ncbi:thioredoxin domain-containing protein [Desulfovibrio sp. JC010]|uniref:thioredoxin domain-containing protein n=1 Tax=Desulfovibrio sp. JC010 TaxID=2593641 RepID=UPI0013D025A6|nr:thioredoxin domain-containing protein [Desulfovibrio sp. JC010]NDV27666.1 disulfide bond formation protein DsbA [Desulfovibrio sp. JC010]
MLKQVILILSVVVLFSGCANKQNFKDQLREALREDPQIVLDVLDENSVAMLAIVDKGVQEQKKNERLAKFESEIKNPMQPEIQAERIMLGNADAPVTIVEYSDFLCPYCSKGANVASKLATEQPEKYRLIFKHLPLHKNSRELAMFFEAIARLDKDKAHRFHDLAFARQKALYEDKSGTVLNNILAEISIDRGQLQKSINSEQVRAFLISDEQEAKNFKINGTPTFLVNGVAIRGYVPVERFEETVDYILEKANPKSAEAPDGEICEDCLNQM